MVNINKRLRKFTAINEIKKQHKKEMQMILITIGILLILLGAIILWLGCAI